MRICTTAGGGLGNRILGSITAYYFSRLLDKKLHIDWPEGNPGCLAGWHDLFTNSENVVNSIVPQGKEDYYIVHDPQYFTDKKNVITHRNRFAPISIDSLVKGILAIDDPSIDVIIQDDGAYVEELPNPILYKFFQEDLKIKKHILDTSHQFCYTNGINNKTIGVHLRLTDMTHYGVAPGITSRAGNREAILEQYVLSIKNFLEKDPSTRFFVCSDDSEAERHLHEVFKYSIITHDKSEYVEKFHKEEGWGRMDTTGEDICRYNVSRSRISVIEALIDCLILSRTNTTLFPRVGSFNILTQYLSLVKFD